MSKRADGDLMGRLAIVVAVTALGWTGTARAEPQGSIPVHQQEWRRPAIWGTAGGAVLGLGLGVVAFRIERQKQADFNAYRDDHVSACAVGSPDSGGQPCARLLSAANSADTWAKVALVGAGVLGVSALVLWLTTPGRPEGAVVASRFGCVPTLDHLGLGCAATF